MYFQMRAYCQYLKSEMCLILQLNQHNHQHYNLLFHYLVQYIHQKKDPQKKVNIKTSYYK